MILVTGATGFIGKNLVKSLEDKKIRCLVRKSSNVKDLEKSDVELFYGELTDKESVDKAVNGVDIVIHLAGELRSVKYETNYKINVLGTKNIVDACIKHRVKKLIFTSSIMVLGKEKSVYGKTKFMAEDIVKEAPLSKIVLRPTMVYGKGKCTLTNIVNYLKKLPFVPVLGDGKSTIQPVFIDDVISAIKSSIKLEEEGIFNLAGPSPFSFNEFIDMISTELGIKKRKVHIPYKISMYSAIFLSKLMERPPVTLEQVLYLNQDKNIDITPAKEKLGFNPKDFKRNIQTLLK